MDVVISELHPNILVLPLPVFNVIDNGLNVIDTLLDGITNTILELGQGQVA